MSSKSIWKMILAGTTALALTGSSLVFAQQSTTKPDASKPDAASPAEAKPSGKSDAAGTSDAPSASGDSAKSSDRPGRPGVDIRLAVFKDGLNLTTEQEKHWAKFETAVEDAAKFRASQRKARRDAPRPSDPVARMHRRADALAERAEVLKRLAEAAQPLYGSLDANQKQRFVVLMRLVGPRRATMGGWHRAMRGGYGPGHYGYRHGRGPHAGHGPRGPGRWHDGGRGPGGPHGQYGYRRGGSDNGYGRYHDDRRGDDRGYRGRGYNDDRGNDGGDYGRGYDNRRGGYDGNDRGSYHQRGGDDYGRMPYHRSMPYHRGMPDGDMPMRRGPSDGSRSGLQDQPQTDSDAERHSDSGSGPSSDGDSVDNSPADRSDHASRQPDAGDRSESATTPDSAESDNDATANNDATADNDGDADDDDDDDDDDDAAVKL